MANQKKPEEMNIYQKLVEVRRNVTYLQKKNQGKQFNYVSSSQVLASVREDMDKMNIFLEAEVTNKDVTVRERNNGNKVSYQFEVDLDMEFSFVNADKPDERVTKKWTTAGNDIGDNSKAYGKAFTYAEKYFLMKQFNIATDKDDPDSFQETTHTDKQKGKAPQTADEQQIANFLTQTDQFAKLRNVERSEVLKALQISNEQQLKSMTEAKLNKHTAQINTWIEKAKETAPQAG